LKERFYVSSLKFSKLKYKIPQNASWIFVNINIVDIWTVWFYWSGSVVEVWDLAARR
jgi:hypothetical protein